MKIDKRRLNSAKKLYILEFYFIRCEYKTIGAIALELSIKKDLLESVLKEWKLNDNCLIVESKINL